MKKSLTILGIYLVLVYIGCLIGSFCSSQNISLLIDGYQSHYKVIRSLEWLMELMPGLLISGFIISCSIIWQKNTSNSVKRFSPAMLNRYKIILTISLILVFILSLCTEVFSPLLNSKLSKMESASREFDYAIDNGSEMLMKKQYDYAQYFAQKSIELAGKDKSRRISANSLLQNVLDAKQIQKTKDNYINSSLEGKSLTESARPTKTKDMSHTVLELLQNSRDAFDKGDYFDAHYWANLAIELCDGTNTNLTVATNLANISWNKLTEIPKYRDKEKEDIYIKKQNAYKAYQQGDYYNAFYIYNELKDLKNTEVNKFYQLSMEELKARYFFFDEVENMINQDNKFYFSLGYGDGSTNVFYVPNFMPIKQTGNLVIYLQNLNVIHYNADHQFEYYFTVPYAKVIAQNISKIDSITQETLGIKKKNAYIPEIILQSIDREQKGAICRPQFFFNESGLPENIKNDIQALDCSNQFPIKYIDVDYSKIQFSTMLLPMEFSDLTLISRASYGAEWMGLIDLNKFIDKADSYGYPKIIYLENLIERTTYPLIMLIVFIWCAVIGWNYRIEEWNKSFKFNWILLIPIISIGAHILLRIVLYICNMCHFILTGIMGVSALLVLLTIYLILFIVVSLIFVGRRA